MDIKELFAELQGLVDKEDIANACDKYLNYIKDSLAEGKASDAYYYLSLPENYAPAEVARQLRTDHQALLDPWVETLKKNHNFILNFLPEKSDLLVSIIERAKTKQDDLFIREAKKYFANYVVSTLEAKKMEFKDIKQILIALDIPIASGNLINDEDEKLGSGATGQVYRGSYKGQEVAIKEENQNNLPGHNISEAAFFSLLQKGTDSHPNVLRLIGLWGGSNMIFECANHDLLKFTFPQDATIYGQFQRCLHYINQIASALAFLASHRMVHADLKPANVLVMEGDRVKICDLGNNLFLEEIANGNDRMLARTTLTYASPQTAPLHCSKEEQLVIEQDHCISLGNDPTIDVYALGLIAHFLFTLQEPNNNMHNEATRQAQNRGKENDPNQSNQNSATSVNYIYCDLFIKKYGQGKPSMVHPDDYAEGDAQARALYRKSYDLVAKMMTVDPNKRISAQEIMKETSGFRK